MINPRHCYSGARAVVLLALTLLAPGCSSSNENPRTDPGITGSGGVASAGQSGTSTTIAPSGGFGTGGGTPRGVGTGGNITEGAHTGGSFTSGAATGGIATGGADTTGATVTGGAATSSAGGGSHATGGAATGGAGVGGSHATGGAATGGSAVGTGGAHVGGTGTGGSSTGVGGAGGTAAFNPCPATGTCAIMPLGDSITDGVGSSQGGGYRVQLFHDAVQGHKSITFVGSATDPNGPATVDGKTFPRNHEGHPGYTVDNSSTTSGISPLVDASIATNHPNIITLMIGTNDLNRNIDPTNFPTRLGALLDKIINDAPNSLVVVAKITPWQDDGTNTSAVEPFNTKIGTLVQTYITSGKHVALVDMYTPFRANSNYKTALMSDYLHPNDAGYVIMGDVWYNAIKNYLPAAP